jgi:Mg/Co/Ni transporter MgtE
MIKEFFIVKKNETLKSIIEKIVLNSHRAVLVIDKKKVIGLISEGDILKSIIYKKDLNANAFSLMNKSFKFLNRKDYSEAKKIFKKHLCSIIPVVDKNMMLKEVITLDELIKFL